MKSEIVFVFVGNVGETLEEAFGKDVVEDWKKICGRKRGWSRRERVLLLLLMMMMMNGMVVRVNVNFEQGGVLWVDNDICCEKHVCWVVAIPQTCGLSACSCLVEVEMVYLVNHCFVSLSLCCHYEEILNYQIINTTLICKLKNIWVSLSQVPMNRKLQPNSFKYSFTFKSLEPAIS